MDKWIGYGGGRSEGELTNDQTYLLRTAVMRAPCNLSIRWHRAYQRQLWKVLFSHTNMDTKRCLLLFHLVFDSGDPFFHLVLFCFNLSALSCYVLIQ